MQVESANRYAGLITEKWRIHSPDAFFIMHKFLNSKLLELRCHSPQIKSIKNAGTLLNNDPHFFIKTITVEPLIFTR